MQPPDTPPPWSFDQLVGEMRPGLHRYCARMVGSVIDAEDIVQAAIVKALEAQNEAVTIAQPTAWIFRIAHNTALDFLRARARARTVELDEEAEMIADASSEADRRMATAASLHSFMRLPAGPRSAVILKDVLGHSIEEICRITDATVPAVKAALHRGRETLRDIAAEPDDRPPPALAPADRARLSAYVEHFNARDFDAIRDLLAEDVRLDLVNRVQHRGKAMVGTYYGKYGETSWRFGVGLVEGRPAILAYDPEDRAGGAKYFIVVEWRDGRITAIRDFLFARYAMEGAEVVAVD